MSRLDAAQAPGPAALPPRRLVELPRAEAMELLASVPFGRVVFTARALPAVRPVNHIVEDGEIVLRTRSLAAISTALTESSGGAIGQPPELVVAYEADLLDPVERLGWSVVVTGVARTVTDPDRLGRIAELLHPWVDSAMDAAVAITPEIVTAYRFEPV